MGASKAIFPASVMASWAGRPGRRTIQPFLIIVSIKCGPATLPNLRSCSVSFQRNIAAPRAHDNSADGMGGSARASLVDHLESCSMLNRGLPLRISHEESNATIVMESRDVRCPQHFLFELPELFWAARDGCRRGEASHERTDQGFGNCVRRLSSTTRNLGISFG